MLENQLCHDDVIKWKHFPRYWPFVRGIHRWIPRTKASDAVLWCAHYDVIVMKNCWNELRIIQAIPNNEPKTLLWTPCKRTCCQYLVLIAVAYLLGIIPAIKFPLGWRHIRVMAPQVTSNSIVCSTACSREEQKYKSSIVGSVSDEATCGFPSQMTSNTESFTMWWRHLFIFLQNLFRMSRLILLMLMLCLVSLHAAKMGTTQLVEVHHDFLQCLHDTHKCICVCIYTYEL